MRTEGHSITDKYSQDTSARNPLASNTHYGHRTACRRDLTGQDSRMDRRCFSAAAVAVARG